MHILTPPTCSLADYSYIYIYSSRARYNFRLKTNKPRARIRYNGRENRAEYGGRDEKRLGGRAEVTTREDRIRNVYRGESVRSNVGLRWFGVVVLREEKYRKQ